MAISNLLLVVRSSELGGVRGSELGVIINLCVFTHLWCLQCLLVTESQWQFLWGKDAETNLQLFMVSTGNTIIYNCYFYWGIDQLYYVMLGEEEDALE